MIRKNYSLANELKDNERKQQNRVQQRQKHQFKREKLSKVDPIRTFRQIERLEQNPDKTDRDITYLKKLKEDWDFIEKNGLHKEQVRTFLNQREKEQEAKAKANSKLWGLKSIYFNPELNPLGKVPGENLLVKPIRTLPNYTKPLDSHVNQKYTKEPILDTLGIVLPEGDPPKFYKMVQNTKKTTSTKDNQQSSAPNNDVILSSEKGANILIPSSLLKKNTKKTLEDAYSDDEYGSENELAPEEEQYLIGMGKLPSKRSKVN